MALDAERRQRIQTIQVPFTSRRITPVMDLQIVRRIAKPASMTVPFKRLKPQDTPLGAGNVFFVRHPHS